MIRPALRCLLTVSLLALAASGQAGMLEEIRDRDTLRCGVEDDLPGFSALREDGRRVGFDADLCRAVAAAVLGDPHRVRFVLLAPAERAEAVAQGHIDLAASGLARSLLLDLHPGVDFAPVVFYDGRAVITRRETGVRTVRDLSGGTVCVGEAATAHRPLDEYIRNHGLRITQVRFDTREEAWSAYVERRCDAFSSPASVLAAFRTLLAAPADHLILPEILSKEPIAPLVGDDDPHWRKTVSWIIFGLIEAEERGIDRENVSLVRADTADREVLRLLGMRDELGTALGLDPRWLARAIEAVGNYGEIFERNVGADSGLRLRRGLNELWTRGGLMYAPPLR